MAASARTHPHKVALALQGGGTHGAFTWGVLDRLLEDGRLEIEAISGTSAGAMNGAVLAQGMIDGGPAAARTGLENLWRRTSQAGWLSPVHRTWLERLQGTWNLDSSLAGMWVDQISVLMSPDQSNPIGLAPARALMGELLDCERLRTTEAIRLFVTATNVRTGKARVFDNADLTIDALVASGCLPQFFNAVEIDGEHYWDGGYLGNPALLPLVYRCTSRDIVIVETIPIQRQEVPKTSAEILNRMNEITFNASLVSDLRTLAFASRLVEQGHATGSDIERMHETRLHLIEAAETMKSLGSVSQLNTDLDFLLYLRDLGRATADQWLQQHLSAIGHRSSVDITRFQ
jgi:NTE family protein